MSFSKHLATAAIFLAASAAHAQGLRDLFREIGKAVEKKVDDTITEKVEGPCIQKQGAASVTSADYQKSGSWIVSTDSGTFQVSALAIGGKVENGNNFGDYLSSAKAAQFTLVDSTRLTKVYRVHLDYSSVVSDRGVGSILNEVYKNKMYNDFRVEIAAIEGTALSGSDWCLNVPTNTLRSLTLVP
jgi:UDP-N-acetylglucosamine transferase subunit ALG13